MDFKNIHIGQIIKKTVEEREVGIFRICNFLKFPEEKIWEMYEAKSLDTEILLRWSKLLEYDFFRIYTQHLILYSPPSAIEKKRVETSLSQFRKNIYTKEVIDFILEKIQTKEMSKTEIMERYKIPKTTLYKWIKK